MVPHRLPPRRPALRQAWPRPLSAPRASQRRSRASLPLAMAPGVWEAISSRERIAPGKARRDVTTPGSKDSAVTLVIYWQTTIRMIPRLSQLRAATKGSNPLVVAPGPEICPGSPLARLHSRTGHILLVPISRRALIRVRRRLAATMRDSRALVEASMISPRIIIRIRPRL